MTEALATSVEIIHQTLDFTDETLSLSLFLTNLFCSLGLVYVTN